MNNYNLNKNLVKEFVDSGEKGIIIQANDVESKRSGVNNAINKLGLADEVATVVEDDELFLLRLKINDDE